LLILLAVIMTTLAGCREEVPRAAPTLSPTPRSTPLPPLPTSAPAGSEDNPIQMVFVNGQAELEAPVQTLTDAIAEASGFAITLTPVTRQAEALAALCNTVSGVPTIAWLDGITALAADARRCGDLRLALERQTEDSGSTTETIQLITNAEINTVAQLSGRIFCRLNASSAETWLYPSLLLQANNVNVVSGLDKIADYDDIPALLAALADGDCDGAGVPAAELVALDEDVASKINVLDVELQAAYGILVYPQVVPLGVRDALDEALLALAADEANDELLQTLFNANSIRPADAIDFASLRETLGRAGLDLAQIGS
jgi:ABC-type phosphate/phosphonate transport system substrate-binding protein